LKESFHSPFKKENLCNTENLQKLSLAPSYSRQIRNLPLTLDPAGWKEELCWFLPNFVWEVICRRSGYYWRRRNYVFSNL